MNSLTAKLINEFWLESQSRKYTLPPQIILYINNLKNLSDTYFCTGNTYTIAPEIERNIHNLLLKISEYRYMHPDLISLFSEAIVSYTDNQLREEKKVDALENLFNGMEVSCNVENKLGNIFNGMAI